MKKYFMLLLVSACCFACSTDDSPLPDLLLDRYTHAIPNCDSSGNFQNNCTEFVSFSSDSKAGILVGGGDIAYVANYTIKKNIITLEQNDLLRFKVSFEIQDKEATTLLRIEDGSLWTR